MKKISFLTLALLIVAAFSLQTASAQFPKLPKIPKPSQPKPQPTQTESTQPAPASETQPVQPQPENRSTTKPAAAGGEVYATRAMPTDTPLFLSETLDIRTDTQDYYWKLPKESNYTSWLPHIKFYVIYAGSTRLRFKADYSMPDGQPWYSESLEQRGLPDSQTSAALIVSEDVSDKDKGKAIVTGGTFGVKITNLRDNSVVFQGKFKVVKYKPENTDERYKNLVDFYVDQDWNLPIGYAALDWSCGKCTTVRPSVLMWFKGGVKSEDLEARLYYNGQQLATTDDGGNVSSAERRFPKHAGNNPALMWNLYAFNWLRKIVFIAATPEARNFLSDPRGKLFINQSPGDYTVKVFYKGEQVRETRFSIADGNFADNGIAKQNKLSTDKVILPVKVMGTVDKWNATTWKTDAFYGNPLTGFSVP